MSPSQVFSSNSRNPVPSTPGIDCWTEIPQLFQDRTPRGAIATNPEKLPGFRFFTASSNIYTQVKFDNWIIFPDDQDGEWLKQSADTQMYLDFIHASNTRQPGQMDQFFHSTSRTPIIFTFAVVKLYLSLEQII